MHEERRLALRAIHAVAAYAEHLAAQGQGQGGSDRQQLDRIEALLTKSSIKEAKMLQDLSAIIETATSTRGTMESAVVVLNGILERLQNAVSTGDLEAIRAETQLLSQSREALATAIATIPA